MKRMTKALIGAWGLILMVSPGAAQDVEEEILKLSVTGEGSSEPFDITVGSGATRVTGFSYGSTGSGGSGVSMLDGPQYALEEPPGGELVYMARGSGTYVSADGTLFPMKPGDFVLIGPGYLTGRDFTNYAHFYITFAAEKDDFKNLPQVQILSPGKLTDSSFEETEDGEEHVFLTTKSGTKVAAMRWKGRAAGSVSDAPARFLTVVSGNGFITQGARRLQLSPGDTYFIPAGADYHWSGEDLHVVAATVGSSDS